MPAAKSSPKQSPSSVEAGYRIGAVSRLTGIATDTLRAWERRYGVVAPQRSTKGGRRYSREDVSRLALIKRLVDAGHAIGSVASLDMATLQERLEATGIEAVAPRPTDATGQRCRVAVFGEALPARLLASKESEPDLDLITVTRDSDTFVKQISEHHPDVIVLEYPSLRGRTVEEVNRLLRISEARLALVVYAFARKEAVRKLRSSRIVPLRAPTDLSDLRMWCLNQPLPLQPEAAPSELEPLDRAPARRFNADELSRVANASTAIKCECPHHLAELIFALRAFEDYSAECENTSDADTALHAYLNNATGHARATLETALARVIAAEGLEL